MNKPIRWIVGTIVVILLAAFAPIKGNNSSLLRTCRFDEGTSTYNKCFWVWDDTLDDPSIYF